MAKQYKTTDNVLIGGKFIAKGEICSVETGLTKLNISVLIASELVVPHIDPKAKATAKVVAEVKKVEAIKEVSKPSYQGVDLKAKSFDELQGLVLEQAKTEKEQTAAEKLIYNTTTSSADLIKFLKS